MVIEMESRVVRRGNRSFCLNLPKRYVTEGHLPEGTNVTIRITKNPEASQ